MRSSSIDSILVTASRAVAIDGGAVLDRPDVPPASGRDETVAREVRLPHYCARCLGDPDDTFVYEQCERRGIEATRASMRVPMCAECLGHVRRRARRAVERLVHCSIGGLVAAVLVWGLTASLGAAWLAAAGLVLGVVLYGLDAGEASVCAIDGGAPYFENSQYQFMFERLNEH